MRLANTQAPAVAVGVTNQSHFSIAATGKAFRVLSDGLYQDKIGSIVRELSCNALDSHIAAGTPERQFRIHLPDIFAPYFEVQDYGIGLSDEQVRSIFTTYFLSTKENTNDMVGAFGLGSKSPFSYTDSFLITSIYNGIKTVYSAFISDNQLPAIVQMGQSETTEDNGVTINLPVKSNDFLNFSNAVRKQLHFFKVKPIIDNSATFGFENLPTESLYADSDIFIGKSIGRHMIIQGQVGYPLNIENLRGKISTDAVDFLSNLNGREVHIYFNIGDIEVTASREGVSYSAHTLNNIEEKLLECSKRTSDFVQAQLGALKTNWEKAVAINNDPILSCFAPGLAGNLGTFRSGRKLAYNAIPKIKDANGINMLRGHTYTHGSERGDGVSDSSALTPESNIVFMVRDTAKRPVVRIRNYVAANPAARVFVFSLVLKTVTFTDDLLNKISESFGGAKVLRVSDLPEPAKATGGYSRPTFYTVSKSMASSLSHMREWEREYDPLTDLDGGVYTIKPSDSNDVSFYGECTTFLNLCNADIVADTTLHIIREGDLKKIENNPAWVRVDEFNKEVTAEIRKDKTLRMAAKLNVISLALREYRHESMINTLELVVAKGGYTPKYYARFARYRDRLTALITKHLTSTVIAKLGYAGFTINISDIKAAKVITDAYSTMANKYAMLSHINNYYSSYKHDYADYVKLVDANG